MKNMNLHELKKDPRWHWWVCDGCKGFKVEKTPVGSPTTLKATPSIDRKENIPFD